MAFLNGNFKKTVFGLLALTATVITPTISAAYDPDLNCKPEIQTILGSIDLKEKTLKNISFVPDYDTHIGGTRIIGIQGWVNFNECKGNLVIRVDSYCELSEMYSVGKCTIPGIPHF